MKSLGATLVLLSVLAVPVTAQIPDEFTNLKAFPKDIGKRELVSEMRQFSAALGMRCKDCHVGPDNLEGMDFATDELESKRVAREMMRMTREINLKMKSATGKDSNLPVRCVTCHRGITEPRQLDEVLAAAADEDGVDAAIARYRELRDEYFGSGSYDFGAAPLGSFAETLAREKGDMDGAIKVTELNLEFNPDDANSHLMLGQLQMQKGDKEGALASINRALELEPDNDYAKRMLARIKAAD
jgi:tetratricopeptide (TPR) repeat protein